MRRYLLIGLLILLPLAARADPVNLSGGSLVAIPVVALAALLVEAGVVALLLIARGAAVLPIFGGYFVTNLVVFIFLFCPMLMLWSVPLAVAELLVVIADALCIKLLVSFETFQGDNYEGVSWLRAGVISIIGNATSFVVGLIISRI